jgi:hypothetical protein
MSTPGIRYAALRLAALHPRDREWLLQRLPAAVRDAWGELTAMRGWQARARHAATLPPPAPVATAARFVDAEAVTADVLAAAPATEPDTVLPAWGALAEAMQVGPLPSGLADALASWEQARGEAA